MDYTVNRAGRPARRLERRRLRSLALSLILLHTLLVALHGAAHLQVGVSVSPAQAAYIGGVIVALPLLAALRLLRARPGGYTLLALSMYGGLAFGLYNHFMLPSPDHVLALPPGPWSTVFSATALLLTLSEAAGAAVGMAQEL